MLRRLLAVVLVTLFGLTVGCGSSTEGNGGNGGTPKGGAAPAKPAKPVAANA